MDEQTTPSTAISGVGDDAEVAKRLEALQNDVEAKDLLLNKLKERAKVFVQQSKGEKKQLEATLKSLQDTLAKKVETEGLLAAKIADLGARCAELETNGGVAAPSAAQVDEMTKQLEMAKRRAAEVEAALVKLHGEKVELEQSSHNVDHQMEVQVGALRQKLSNAEHDRERAENMRLKMKDELNAALSQRLDMENHVSGFKDTIRRQSDELKALRQSAEATAASLNARAEKAEGRLKEAEDALMERREEREKLRDEIEKLSNKLLDEQKQKGSFEEALNALRTEMEDMRSVHEHLHKEKEQSTLETKEVIAKKELELQAHKQKRMNAKSEIVNIATSLERHQDVLKSTVHGLRMLIFPCASEQVLSLQSLQSKIDDMIKRIDPSYIIPITASSPRASSEGTFGHLSDDPKKFLKIPTEILSRVESEMQVSITTLGLLDSKLKRLREAIEDSGGGMDGMNTPGGKIRRGRFGRSGRGSGGISVFAKICPKFFASSAYSKVLDPSDV